MGILTGTQDFERYLEGLFKDRLRGRVSPVDIARRLYREMKEARRVSVLRIYVPASFMVGMHQADIDSLGECLPHLGRELAVYLQEKARAHGYTMIAPPQVSFVVDEGLGPGNVKVEARFKEGSRGILEDAVTAENTRCFTRVALATGASPQARLLVVSGPDRDVAAGIDGAVVVIGRDRGCDFVLTDPSVSRRHAGVKVSGEEYVLADLNSTNGVYVGGLRTARRVLADGDTVTLGNTVILFNKGK
ncbi:MAG: DUF3662 and FHA domain-containing protein [Peptococcaceae bacterium]|jgi:hypothetical protein|nr:DUF3662 and FHA domain-containing protein [Peptococcaceae bacterium]